MKPWLERQLQRVPARSGLAEAIRYALARWDALCRFLDDGRIELDTNTVERAIRPITLGRKNHLFEGRAAPTDGPSSSRSSRPPSSMTSNPTPT